MDKQFVRERGYLTFAQNSGNTDYLRMAYALALSLKATQPEHNQLSVVITPDTKIPDRYRAVFDTVIDVPWLDEARQSAWKLENEWKAYHVTPYRHTIKLDADMLFTSSMERWWQPLAQQDVAICNEVETYRGEIITDDTCRKTFTANNLPNVYTAFMSFKYSDLAEQIFKMAEMIFHNYERFSEFLDPVERPTTLSTDVVFALAIKLLGVEDQCFLGKGPRFVHMKSPLQNWPKDVSDDWSVHVKPTLTKDLQFKVGLYRQSIPFHYYVKSALSDDIIKTYEKVLGI